MAASPLSIASFLSSQSAQRTQLGQDQQRIGQGQQGLDIQKQQEQIREQQEQREARQADLEFHQHLVDLGAVPGDARSGLIKDTQTMPSYPDGLGDGQPLSIVRKMDSARTVKFKDADGEDVAYELPDAQTQALRQLRLGAPKRAAEVQQAGETSQAQATGTAAGATSGKTADLDARGVPVDANFAQKYQLPTAMVGMKLLPEQVEAMSQRLVPAQTRADASVTTTGMRDDSAEKRTQMRAEAQASVQTAKDQATQQRQKEKLDYQNKWEQAKAAISGNAQANLNNRVLMQQFDASQKQHGLLHDEAYKESQKQLDAQALIDPKSGVQDGEDFTNPFDGKKTTMNAAQRARLQLGIGSSQAQVQDLKTRAGAIEQRYGLNGQPAQGGGGQPAAGGTPAAPAAKPAAAAPKYKVGDSKTYNGGNYKFDGTQWVLQKQAK